MRTSKPIATISYNSEDFLNSRLNELMRNHSIVFWAWVEHTPESDESKCHKHLYIEPNRMLDSAVLSEFFREPDPKHPDKPLGVVKWTNSNPDDWILYAQHDPAYLASKLESREYQYTLDNFHRSSDDDFDMMVRHAYNGSEWSKRNRIMQMVERDPDNAYRLISDGCLPLQMANQLRAYLDMLEGTARVHRNGHDTHD